MLATSVYGMEPVAVGDALVGASIVCCSVVASGAWAVRGITDLNPAEGLRETA
jgi:hypothetical protein